MSNTHGKLTVGVPSITCDRLAWEKLIGYSKCKALVTVAKKKKKKKMPKVERRMVEISGMGLAVQNSANAFHIQDFFLVPSKGSGASTEIDNDGMAALVLGLMTSDTPEDVGNLKVWWHTHPGMGLTWSKRDEDQMESFGEESKYPWLLSIVTDGAGDYRCRLDCFEEMGIRTWFDGLAIEVLGDTSLQEELQAEVDEKVTVEPLMGAMGHNWARSGKYRVNDYRRFKGKFPRQGYLPTPDTRLQGAPTQADWEALGRIRDPHEYQERFDALVEREEGAHQDQCHAIFD